MRNIPKYKKENTEEIKDENNIDEDKNVSTELSNKTNQLLEFIEKKYLNVILLMMTRINLKFLF